LTIEVVWIGGFSVLSKARAIYETKCTLGQGMIVGGSVTMPGEFPNQAAIGWLLNGQLVYPCGGTLVSELFVLTAAHCTRFE